MNRTLLLAFALVFCGQTTKATNPSDIEFTLRLTSNSHSYHMGESIGFEVSYSSTSEQKYLASQSSLIPGLAAVGTHITPSENLLDLVALNRCSGFGGSILSGGPTYLNAHPVTEEGDLTKWYRFYRPGHYSFFVTSGEVWRQRSSDEGGGRETLTLESNTVEFDVLPSDPSWEASELQDILHAIDSAKYPGDLQNAQYRLGVLDTPESTHKLVELFVSSPRGEKLGFISSLTVSPRLDLLISLLEDAIANPQTDPTEVPQLLADVHVWKQFGVVPTFADDPAGQQQFQAACLKRRELRSEYMARASSLLQARLSQGAGPQNNAALFEAWLIAENQNGQNDTAPQSLVALRLAVLNVAESLEPSQQTQFLFSEWKRLPHEQLLPLVHSMASAHVVGVFRFWCEGWPDECSAAIFSDASKPDTKITANDVLRASEAEHPEMDSILQEQLGSPAMARDSPQSIRTATLVLRAGSKKLLPLVEDALTQSNAKHSYNCQVQAYLLGYLFRESDENAQARLRGALEDEKCGSQLLRLLNTARYSDDLIPVAVRALESANLDAAGTAAIFLGDHASIAVKDPLWQRLDSLWTLWRDKASELQQPLMSSSIQWKTSELEQNLASALAHATNWKLTPSEQQRLRNGCLTETCRAIADGKMSRGL